MKYGLLSEIWPEFKPQNQINNLISGDNINTHINNRYFFQQTAQGKRLKEDLAFPNSNRNSQSTQNDKYVKKYYDAGSDIQRTGLPGGSSALDGRTRVWGNHLQTADPRLKTTAMNIEPFRPLMPLNNNPMPPMDASLSRSDSATGATGTGTSLGAPTGVRKNGTGGLSALLPQNQYEHPSTAKTIIDDNDKWAQKTIFTDYAKQNWGESCTKDTNAGVEHFRAADDYMECDAVIRHARKCPNCYQYIRNNLGLNEASLIDGIPNTKLLDVLLYVMGGVFLLFTLDMVLKYRKK
jgi:hypothetical protein